MGRAVDAWLTHLDVERGRSRHTLGAYRRDLARWTAYLGAVGVDHPEDVREAHVSEFLIKEIEHFFTRYKDLEPGKWVKAEGWGDRAAAEAELEASIKRYVPHTH